MTSFIKKILPLLILVAPLAHADILKCNGTYSNGNPMHVIFDQNSNVLNVDGDVHSVVTSNPGNEGLATEDFENENGKMVYIAIVNNNNSNLNLKIFEQQNNNKSALVDVVHLTCSKV